MSPESQELLDLNQRLLDAIDQRDWAIYTALCDPSLTAFEPEARGNLVSGMRFHAFYLEGEPEYRSYERKQSSLSSFAARFLGRDVAIATYVRLVQIRGDFQEDVLRFEETRVWQRQDGQWRHVHFHRSRPGET